MSLKIFVFGEFSGVVRDAFTYFGHDAISCDFKKTISPGHHIVGDGIPYLYQEKYDLVIAHPPLTDLSLIRSIYDSPQQRMVIELPAQPKSFYLGMAQQLIYPYYFGDPHKRKIFLWFKNMPPLISSIYSTQRKPMANHVNSSMSSQVKNSIKSKFFPAVALTMALQWGSFIEKEIDFITCGNGK